MPRPSRARARAVSMHEGLVWARDQNIADKIISHSSTVYIGIAQVTRHQPFTFENLNFHFHYAFHFTFEEINVKNR